MQKAIGEMIFRRTAITSSHIFGNVSDPLSFFYSDFHNVGHKLKPMPTSTKYIDFDSVKDVDDVVCLFRQMMSVRPHSVVESTKLLGVVVKIKHYYVAISVFNEMHRLSAPKNEYTLNIIINCYCLLNRVEFGLGIIDVTTFDTIIKGLYSVGKVGEATKIFEMLMFHQICEPNDVMVSTVINGLCKADQTLIANDLLGLYENTSYTPTVYDYSVIIDAFCKMGMLDNVLQLLRKIKEKGVSPHAITYTSII
ncbi:hypothetical protein Pfo_026922 [Paulownia fortunei]|nr:hypothetical protein Pfo_026922 [Paulownia fortunei]